MQKRLITLAFLAVSGSTFASSFLPGDLVVSVVDGTTSAAQNDSIVELTTGGSLVQTINLPSNFTNSGSATSEGALVKSGNGQYLTMAGYTAAAGTASIASTGAAANPRTIARIKFDGTVDTSTSFNNVFDKNNIRSAFTSDGSNFWAAGANSGQVYGAFGTTTGTAISTTVTNTRVIQGFGGDLYFSTGAGANHGIWTIAGMPTSGSATATLVLDTGSSSSPYDFAFADPNTLYVTDDTASGGLFKYTKNGGTWSLAYSQNSIGLRSIAVSGNTIYGISTGNTLVSYADNGGSFGGPVTIATAASGTNFRGVELSPVPEPATMAILGIGLAGMISRRRNRKA